MAGALIFSLAMAAIALLVFGEHMGLPAGLAAFGVVGVLGAVLLASAIFSATSRLGRFVIGEGRGAAFSGAAIAAVLLILGHVHLVAGGHGVLPAFVWLTTGFVVGQFFLPADPWLAIRPASEVGHGAGVSVADGLRGATKVIMLAASLGAIALLASLLPVLADRVIEASGWSPPVVFRTLVALVCILALVGGLVSVRRAVIVGLAFAALLLVLPVAPEGLRNQLPPAPDGGAIRQFAQDVFGHMAARGQAIVHMPDVGAAIAGFLIGLAAQQALGTVSGMGARSFSVIVAILLAVVILSVIEFNGMRLQSLVTGLSETAPAQWPVFVYDDVLRGWLSACGAAPDDARQVARACGTIDPRMLLPAGALRFDNGLAMPALAASTGLPVILGFLWALLPLTLVLAGCGMLLLVAATGAGEALPGDVSALRSSRLARVRLAVLGLSALALAAVETGYRIDPAVVRWLMLGACLLGLAGIIAGWLILTMRTLRTWRRARAPAGSGAETCAG